MVLVGCSELIFYFDSDLFEYLILTVDQSLAFETAAKVKTKTNIVHKIAVSYWVVPQPCPEHNHRTHNRLMSSFIGS